MSVATLPAGGGPAAAAQLVLRDLRKRYGGIEALRGASLRIDRPGTVLGDGARDPEDIDDGARRRARAALARRDRQRQEPRVRQRSQLRARQLAGAVALGGAGGQARGERARGLQRLLGGAGERDRRCVRPGGGDLRRGGGHLSSSGPGSKSRLSIGVIEFTDEIPRRSAGTDTLAP